MRNQVFWIKRCIFFILEFQIKTPNWGKRQLVYLYSKESAKEQQVLHLTSEFISPCCCVYKLIKLKIFIAQSTTRIISYKEKSENSKESSMFCKLAWTFSLFSALLQVKMTQWYLLLKNLKSRRIGVCISFPSWFMKEIKKKKSTVQWSSRGSWNVCLTVRTQRKVSDFHVKNTEHKNMASSASHEGREKRKGSGRTNFAMIWYGKGSISCGPSQASSQ